MNVIAIQRITVALLIAICVALPVGARPSDDELVAMAARFRTLRAEAKADTERSKPELRNWGGELHTVMANVGDRIEAQRLSAVRVRELIGNPDEVAKGPTRHATVDVPRGETHWIYEWRGGHDYLYLVLTNGRVTAARWWFAGE